MVKGEEKDGKMDVEDFAMPTLEESHGELLICESARPMRPSAGAAAFAKMSGSDSAKAPQLRWKAIQFSRAINVCEMVVYHIGFLYFPAFCVKCTLVLS